MPALLAPGYRPQSPSNDLKDLLEEHLDEFLRVYDERRSQHGPLHPRVKDLFREYLRCGDPHFGFARLKCVNPSCKKKHELVVPFSCKSRGLCPSCGAKRALLWAERMVSEVLPDVPYVQLVFTIPKMLRPLFLWDRSLYGDLSRAAYASVRVFLEAQFPALERAVPAMLAAPQSHGSLLNFHPHTHTLVSRGVFSRDGVFHPAPEDLDFSPLEDLFREEVFKLLLRREQITPERVQLLRSWRHSGFRVDASRRVERGDREALERLLEYFERPPLSLSRLEYLPDGSVLYRGNFHPSLGRDYQHLSPLEFLALLVPHIALRFECRIYCYGALSTTIRKALGWIQEESKSEEKGTAPAVVVAEEEAEFVKLRRRSWARLIQKVYLDDPTLCPSCSQPMRVIAILTHPHQEEAIEKILRSRGQWAPPWQRERRVRAPPSLDPTRTASETSAPAAGDDDFNQVPPGDPWNL